MTTEKLMSYVDHTLLTPTAVSEDYRRIVEEGVTYGVASVCISPSRVAECAAFAEGRVKICTVAGFPNGYAATKAKAHEAEVAIAQGATEIDMVIDIGRVKEQNFKAVQEDIAALRTATAGYILKVIIETVVLTQDEKIALCQVVSEAGADYIKTSTGFASGGATFEDVALLRKHVSPEVKVKAAGGIATLEDAYKFIELGADRLGTSRIVKLVQGANASGY